MAQCNICHSRSVNEKGATQWVLLVFGALWALAVIEPAPGQPLDDIQTQLLRNFCAELSQPDDIEFFANVGPELDSVCNPAGSGGGTPGGSAVTAGGGAGASRVSGMEVARYLEEVREGESKQSSGGGAGAEATASVAPGLSVFLSVDGQSLDRERDRFVDRYDSDIWSITGGGDYRIREWLIAGLAFNFNRWDGDFGGGGDFETDSYGPIAYATFFPLKGFFADVTLAYARKDYDRSRRVAFADAATELSGGPGIASADYNADEFGAGLLVGYDQPIGRFTIGPRVGLEYVYTDFDDFTEKGRTGLELRFHDHSESLLQSRVGVEASTAFSTRFGWVVPQLNVDWLHQFEADRESMTAQFAQDGRANPRKFNFEGEQLDTDTFRIGFGISTVFTNGPQLFAQFRAMIGDDKFDSYGGTIGFRYDL